MRKGELLETKFDRRRISPLKEIHLDNGLRNILSISQATSFCLPLTPTFAPAIVGTEGQILLGAIFALWGGVNFTYLPSILHIPLVCLLGFVAAGVWCMIFGVLKAKFGINEIITTLLTNYLVFWLAHYLVHWDIR